jgi:hypothetical protein
MMCKRIIRFLSICGKKVKLNGKAYPKIRCHGILNNWVSHPLARSGLLTYA